MFFKPYYATYENGVRRVHPQSVALEEHLKTLRAKGKKLFLKNGGSCFSFFLNNQNGRLVYFFALLVGTPPPKRIRKSAEVNEEPIELGKLIEVFSGEGIDYPLKREETFADRKSLLQTRGVIDYDLYLFTIGLDLRCFEEVSLFFGGSPLLQKIKL